MRTWKNAALPLLLAGAVLAACAETGVSPVAEIRRPDPDLLVYCSASLRTERVSCGTLTAGGSAALMGGQGVYVRLESSNVGYSEVDSIFRFDVTLQNLLPEMMGSQDGSTLDPAGIRIFFHSAPTVTAGSGSIDVVDPDGFDAFTAAAQPYYRYDEMLARNQVSAAREWQLRMPPSVETFGFVVAVATEMTPALVINEVLANPGGDIFDSNGEWFEVYNAGMFAVDLQGYVIADSAASGRRPYHLIASSLVVAPGGYVVLGNSTNTTLNGGVPVDYAYGAALALANSLDAVKIARVVGEDTATIDRVQYASAAISAQNGISRELKNPALNNADMDGSNWGDAAVTAVYGSGGRGTPGAQNSVYTP